MSVGSTELRQKEVARVVTAFTAVSDRIKYYYSLPPRARSRSRSKASGTGRNVVIRRKRWILGFIDGKAMYIAEQSPGELRYELHLNEQPFVDLQVLEQDTRYDLEALRRIAEVLEHFASTDEAFRTLPSASPKR